MDEDDQQKKLRRVYGRGYRDGMKAEKMQRIEDSITTTARKVLTAVPIQEAWTIHQITAELLRTGVRMNHPVIEGCLKSLMESKLVREYSAGHYQRITPRVRLVDAPELKQEGTVPQPTQSSAPKDLMERAELLAKLLRNAADEVETIALEFDKALQQAKSGNAELEQLSALIKKLSKET